MIRTRAPHRRALLSGIGITLLWTALPRSLCAAPADETRLAYRLDLWRTYSRKTRNLVARYTSKRRSSMLVAPLRNAGVLAFTAPGTLLLRDDDIRGSTTRIAAGRVAITPNDAALPRSIVHAPDTSAGLRWLRDHLLLLFAPVELSALRADCRVRAPRGRTPRLAFLPEAGSVVRKSIRSLEVSLDPVGGAISRVDIAEAQGDSLTLEFSDRRQNVPASELAAILQTAGQPSVR
ncbi:MAG: hypothetical protein V3V08_14175 [Nannocystaceae bacterium]